MKTQIKITGQIGGNHRLLMRITSVGNRIESVEPGMFYSKIITFETKRAAKQALWKAYTSLCAEEPNARGHFGGIRYSSGSALYYDASQAEIIEN
jgi:hypothetical protein